MFEFLEMYRESFPIYLAWLAVPFAIFSFAVDPLITFFKTKPRQFFIYDEDGKLVGSFKKRVLPFQLGDK